MYMTPLCSTVHCSLLAQSDLCATKRGRAGTPTRR